MTEKEFNISGMTCQHCVKAVEKELAELNIDYYEVEIGLAKIRYNENLINVNDIVNAIEEAGYSVN